MLASVQGTLMHAPHAVEAQEAQGAPKRALTWLPASRSRVQASMST